MTQSGHPDALQATPTPESTLVPGQAKELDMLRKNVLAHALVVITALAVLPACAQDHEFDLVILNGRVMDPETNFDDIRNVGFKDG